MPRHSSPFDPSKSQAKKEPTPPRDPVLTLLLSIVRNRSGCDDCCPFLDAGYFSGDPPFCLLFNARLQKTFTTKPNEASYESCNSCNRVFNKLKDQRG